MINHNRCLLLFQACPEGGDVTETRMCDECLFNLTGFRRTATAPTNDPVNHPGHYTSHPSGIECITITEHMGFNLGNALKYVWRADLKNDAIEDLEKARWYLDRELALRRRQDTTK